MIQAHPKRRVVIAGGGTAGWMAAAALARTLGSAIELTLVESDAIGTIGVGESTIPPLVTYNRLLGIGEAEFMQATQATFKLGIAFENWKTGADAYFHSFGVTGRDHWSAGFQHFWLHGQTRGHDAPYDEYCLELKAAMASRFAHLPDNRMNYAYQLDSTLYAAFLRRMAESDGARRIEGRIARVELDPENGHIAALMLDSGTRIAGDLFIDCTGFRALLIEGALHVGYDDWSHYLPCDSAIAVQTASVRPPVPYTRAIAHEAGWQWRIPLQHRQGNGIVWCSRYLTRDAALDRLLGTIEGERLTEPNVIGFTTGARRRQWHRNCIAVGLSGGFMEPLESTSIHLVQAGIARLLEMLPTRAFEQADIRRYNRLMTAEFESIRDFLILHFHATARDDTAYWRNLAAMRVPDSLAERIAIHRRTGRVYREADELFTRTSWLAVMEGQGLRPEGFDPIALGIPLDTARARLSRIAEVTRAAVGHLPPHADFIARHCAAPQEPVA